MRIPRPRWTRAALALPLVLALGACVAVPYDGTYYSSGYAAPAYPAYYAAPTYYGPAYYGPGYGSSLYIGVGGWGHHHDGWPDHDGWGHGGRGWGRH